MENNKYMWCEFCSCKIKKISSNNGRCIAEIIGKKEIRICWWCNRLEIVLRFYGNKKEVFNEWYVQQHSMSKFSIKNKGYYKKFTESREFNYEKI